MAINNPINPITTLETECDIQEGDTLDMYCHYREKKAFIELHLHDHTCTKIIITDPAKLRTLADKLNAMAEHMEGL